MKREGGGGKGEGWGFTLVEVLVVLALLSLTAGIGGLALASLDAPAESEVTRVLARGRVEAIRSGRPVSVTATHTDTVTPHALRPTHRFFPDGSARGPGVDLLTGAPRAEP